MFLCLLTDELCTKEENDKTGCKRNFGHEYIYIYIFCFVRNNQYHVLDCNESFLPKNIVNNIKKKAYCDHHKLSST